MIKPRSIVTYRVKSHMTENAREYLDKKFELANNCLAKSVEYNRIDQELPLEFTSDEEFGAWLQKKEDKQRELWSPLSDFQKSYQQEPNYYIKKGAFYSRVFFTTGLEETQCIITDEKIPKRFIENQLKRDPWSIVITQNFIKKYVILHLIWFVSIMRTQKPGEPITQKIPQTFEFPDYVPKCKHCGTHFTKLHPNQRYCEGCKSTVRKMGFNPMIDKEGHRFCLNCGKHLPNNKHKKAKFCRGACRIAFFRKKKKDSSSDMK